MLQRQNLEQLESATPATTFADLGFDSLGVVELSCAIEDRVSIKIRDEDLLIHEPKSFTLGQYFAILQGYITERETIPGSLPCTI